MPLLSDPNALITKLTTKLNYGDYLPGANPMVEAARQRLQGTQQDLLGQNAALQQQQLQMRMQRRQQAMLRDLVARTQSSPYSGSAPNGKTQWGGPFGEHYAGAAPKGSVLDWINLALEDTGHTGRRHDALANGLYQMIMRESGGNPNAINNWDSNAKAGTPSIGLMQTILPTFNAYALPGHRNIRNPVDNIIAGLRYALRRYGPNMVMAGGRHDAYGNYLGY